MLDRKLTDTVHTIEDGKNPEIHHYHHGSHPGISWYIKTVIPGPTVCNQNILVILDFWQKISSCNPSLIRLVDSAYDWDGVRLHGWWTVWLNVGIDVSWSWDESIGFSYEIIEYHEGLRSSASRIRNWLNQASTTRHLSDDQIHYEKLNVIAGFLETYSSESESRAKRSRLQVISDEEICFEAVDRIQLDTKRGW